MSDFYTEQLVKRKVTAKTYVFKLLLIILTVISFLASLMIPIMGIIILVVMIFIDTYFFRRLNLEFEYFYMNGDLDVDKIMGQQTRKRVFSVNINDVEIIASQGHEQLIRMRPEKTYDFSSMKSEHKKYEMIVSKNNKLIKVIFEPNGKILEGMKSYAPRKVFI